MRPNFHPLLVNDVFEDPCLFINFLFENRAIAFDLGDIHNLSSRDILKLTHIFVSHTHIDHFAGFDRFLRIALGRDKTVHIFGPRNFLANIEGKLASYTWNLADNYEKSLVLRATEVTTEGLYTQTYACRDHFIPKDPVRQAPPSCILTEEPGFTVKTVILDHGIPCLGFCLDERFHINIKKDALTSMGLVPGPWLQDFKKALYENMPPDTIINARGEKGEHPLTLEKLADSIAVITQGQKIVYITDVVFNRSNREKIVLFAQNADQLFMESYFLDSEKDIASAKHHLTAKQAGEMAGMACAKKLIPFHFSPRYTACRDLVEIEAMESFAQAMGKAQG